MEISLPSELQELLHSIRASLDNLESDIIPSIRSSTNFDSFDTNTSAGRDEFTFLERKLDDAEVLGDECEDDNQCAQALDKIRELRQRSGRLRISLRTTSLEAKRKIASNSLVASRAELLKSNTDKATKSDRSKSSNPDEALMSASTDVTESLKSTLNLMRQELDRSVLSTQMLEQQTKTLKLTSNQYTTFGDLLTTSKALITSIQRADFVDRLILGAALIFFGLVCLYILKKRILDRGISIITTVARIKPVLTKSEASSEPILENVMMATTTAMALIPLVTSTPKIPDVSVPKQEISSTEPDFLTQPVNEDAETQSIHGDAKGQLSFESSTCSIKPDGDGQATCSSNPDTNTDTDTDTGTEGDTDSMCSMDSDTDPSSTCSSTYNPKKAFVPDPPDDDDDPLSDHDEL